MNPILAPFILALSFPSLLTVFGSILSPPRQLHSGTSILEKRDGFVNVKATPYDANDIHETVCGDNPGPLDFVVALDPNHFPGSCHKFITITYQNNISVGKVVDQCLVCDNGDIDLSNSLFSSLAPIEVGLIHVNWSWVTSPTSTPTQAPTTIPSSSLNPPALPTHSADSNPPPLSNGKSKGIIVGGIIAGLAVTLVLVLLVLWVIKRRRRRVGVHTEESRVTPILSFRTQGSLIHTRKNYQPASAVPSILASNQSRGEKQSHQTETVEATTNQEDLSTMVSVVASDLRSFSQHDRGAQNHITLSIPADQAEIVYNILRREGLGDVNEEAPPCYTPTSSSAP